MLNETLTVAAASSFLLLNLHPKPRTKTQKHLLLAHLLCTHCLLCIPNSPAAYKLLEVDMIGKIRNNEEAHDETAGSEVVVISSILYFINNHKNLSYVSLVLSLIL